MKTTPNNKHWLGLLTLCTLPILATAESIDLSGKWMFDLDPGDIGVAEQWFHRELPETVNLPGCLQAQGFGDEVSIDTPWTGGIVDRSYFSDPRYEEYRQPGNIKVPFWLQPEKYYQGAAWYQKTVRIPRDWRKQRILLRLERSHWETTVWVDDQRIGTDNSLSTPHVYDLSRTLSPGQHQLTIRVDNRMIVEVGVNSHSVSDHTQSNWNGLVGDLRLIAMDPVWIEDLQVYPDAANRSARVVCRLGNATGHSGTGVLHLESRAFNTRRKSSAQAAPLNFDFTREGITLETELTLGADAPEWDEFNPALHELFVRLEATVNGQTFSGNNKVVFGLREFATEGTQFMINGRRTFLRGTLECSIFPLTGFPPTEVKEWKRIIRQCQAFGLNHMRFHSWCPPEAAFAAADELGFYFQIECASWANQGASIGDGKPLDEWIYAEGDRILRDYGNHPSFVMLAYGNEPAGGNQKAWLGRLNAYWKTKDPRRLYTSAAGWPLIPESDFYSSPTPRIQAWGAGNKSRINARPPATETDFRSFVEQHDKPVVSHEIGQWCAFPNFNEIKKYRGYLKPRNFEIFRETLEKNHMGNLAQKFLMASGKLQTLCYKEEIESALRTPGLGGFQLLDLHDFPGQGTALVGVLDPFWEEKGYVTGEEYSRFCNSTVPLARLVRRTWTQNEPFHTQLEVAHFGTEPMKDAILTWKLVNDRGRVFKEGRLGPADITCGNGVPLGEVNFRFDSLEAPAKYKFVVGLEETIFENDWDIWLYPEKIDTSVPPGIRVVSYLAESALGFLQQGGRVLLMPEPESVITPVKTGFSSIFWNTAWTGNQAPHTLGILCNPKHPALRGFPTEYHSDWQWWELTNAEAAAAMVLDNLPPQLRPIVQPIDTWFENRRLGLLYEARVGRGRLLVCSMDLLSDLDNRPAARQMRHSLLRYMDSNTFRPKVEIQYGQINQMIRKSDTE